MIGGLKLAGSDWPVSTPDPLAAIQVGITRREPGGDREAFLPEQALDLARERPDELGAGAVAVPLNPLSPAHELERELAAVGARAVLVGPSGRRTAEAIDRVVDWLRA